MAVYSAAATRIINQRTQSAKIDRYSSSGRRVLPLSGYNERLASTAQDAIDEDISRRYEDGLVAHEEYLDHLQGMLRRSAAPSDRTKIADAIRDVSRAAEVESLESFYASSEGYDKVSAAQSLVEYYKKVANETQPGTPANSQAVAQAAKWGSQAANLGAGIEKDQRTATRLAELARVSYLPGDDPDSVIEKANVYYALSQQALSDGAEDEANRYLTQANSLVERAQSLAVTKQKKEIIGYMNEVKNEYQDGKVGPYEMLSALEAAEKAADETGDYTLAVRINNERASIERDIERKKGEAKGGLRKQGFETMDTIELDLKRLEASFRTGQPFAPESDFFKQYIEGEGVPTLEDLVTLKNLGFSALSDVVGQLEDAGIDVSESRRATIETTLQESNTQRTAFVNGRLVAVVDPGTGEIALEDLDTPEEAAGIYTDPSTGLSFSLIDRNSGANAASFEERQAAITGGYASPKYFASTGNLTTSPDGTQAPYEIVLEQSLFGVDALRPDTKVDSNVPLYETAEKGVYAVRASDVGVSDDPNSFLKVTSKPVNKGGNTITQLKVTREATSPEFSIDPVIVVPGANGGLDRIFIKKNPVTGAIDQFYSQNQNRVVDPSELPNVLRGKIEDMMTDQGGQDVTQPTTETQVKPENTVVGPQADIPYPEGVNISGGQDIVRKAMDMAGMPSISPVKIPSFGLPSFIKPSASERQSGADLRGSQYDTQIIAGKKASDIADPRTLSDKVVSGGLRLGAAVQTQLQKIPLLGNLFK